MKNFFFLSLFATFLLFSCSSDSNSNQNNENSNVVSAKVFNFSTSTNATTYTSGDTLHFVLHTIDSTDSISADSVVISIDNVEYPVFVSSNKFELPTQNLKVGEHKIQALVKFNHNTEFHTLSIVLLSDIVPAQAGFKIKKTYPHDKQAYTQGLFFHNGFLYEGTGMNERSSLRKVKLETGEVLQSTMLASEFFGEGITLYKGKIIQLTWKSQMGFVYDFETMKQTSQFSFNLEGWGIEAVGDTLYVSDGSAQLYLWNAETLTEIGRMQVFDNKGPVVRLNELEYINGFLYANIYGSDLIAKIDLKTGKVVQWIDLTGILPPMIQSTDVDVLNGIAYDRENKRLFVTGKNWPKLFEIEIVNK